MIGACAGDIIGSIYEGRPFKSKEFPLFGRGVRYTDDSVLTIATAAVLLGNFDTTGESASRTPRGAASASTIPDDIDASTETSGDPTRDHSRAHYARAYKKYGRYYKGRGYGGNFSGWLRSDSLDAYGSFGNGSAMRVSPVGLAFETEEEVLAEAQASSAATHDHFEGIKGAQAIALAVFLARRGSKRDANRDTKEAPRSAVNTGAGEETGASNTDTSPDDIKYSGAGDTGAGDIKDKIRREIEGRFGYDLSRSIEEIRPSYRFNPTCQGSVPESIICFLEANSWEDAVRNAISLGGDADTMADMAGAIAEAYYGGVPKMVREQVGNNLAPEMWETVETFYRRFGLPLDDSETGDRPSDEQKKAHE